MKLTVSFLATAVLFANTAWAQSTLPPDLKTEVNTIIGQAINGVTIFSSQSTVSSGSFTIDNQDAPDSEFEVFRLPFSFDLTKEDTFTPFIDGSIGYFRLVEQIPPAEGDGENDFSRIRTWSAGLGTGVRIAPSERVKITPAFSAFYSHTKNSYDYNNAFSQIVLEPFGKELFGWDLETMTYVPSLRVQYDVPVGSPTLLFWTKYSHLFNESISTNSPTIDISSDTGLWQNSAGIKVPLNVSVQESQLAIRSALTRTDVYGSGRKGLEFGHFYELSVDLVAQAEGLLKELSLGASYSFGEDFSGYRLGAGFDF